MTGERSQALMKLPSGMRYEFMGFDYALVIPPSELGLIHKVSIMGKIPGF